MLKLHILASGSRGNAAVVENAATGRGVLIDCGICKRDFFARCDEAGFDPAKLDAVLITHEHGDHTKGIGVTMRGLAKLGRRPAIYAAPATLRASKPLQEIEETCEIHPLAPEALVSAAGMSIFPFATSHDAAASFGFRFEADGDAAGFMTDSGIVTDAAHAHLQDVRLLALESNHDPRMLSEGPYPYVVKRRIASDEGTSFQRTGGRRARCASEHASRSGGGHARIREQQRIRPGETRVHRRRCARRAPRPHRLRIPRSPDDAFLA